MATNAERTKAILEATRKSVTDRDKLSDQAVAELVTIYDDAGEEIAQQIQVAAAGGNQVPLSNLQDLLKQVREELDKLEEKRTQSLYRHVETSAGLGVKPFALDLPSSQLFAINHGAVRFVHTFVGADGLQLSDRLWRLRRGDTDIIAGHIQTAIINGESAHQAVLRAMGAGEDVPEHIAQAWKASQVGALKNSVRELMTGAPDPATGRGVVYQAERLFRTEINRAHGEAYMGSAFAHPDVAGVKFRLSPNHRVRDICDTLASADNYGLGPGVYPSRAACPWPAHPFTRSYVEVVFRDEIGQAAKPEPQPSPIPQPETPMQEPAQQTNGPLKPLRTLGEVLPAGRAIADRLLQGGPLETFVERLHAQLNQARSTMTPCKVVSSGKGADLVKGASMLFPDAWTKVADAHGPLNVRASKARGFCYEATQTERRIKLPVFGAFRASVVGEGFISTDNFRTAVHEFAHRLQHSVPGLDDLFQDLHHMRTAGHPLETLRQLLPGHGYGRDEVTRKDDYVHAYQGRIYSDATGYIGKHGALEVMTMAFEGALSGNRMLLAKLVEKDREMLDLVVGALFHYVP